MTLIILLAGVIVVCILVAPHIRESLAARQQAKWERAQHEQVRAQAQMNVEFQRAFPHMCELGIGPWDNPYEMLEIVAERVRKLEKGA